MAKLRSLFLERTPTCVSDHHPKASERIGLRLIDFHRLHFRWLPRVRKGAVDAHVDVRRAIHENLDLVDHAAILPAGASSSLLNSLNRWRRRASSPVAGAVGFATSCFLSAGPTL